MNSDKGTIGVLALQGDFPMHIAKLLALHVNAKEIRTTEDLEGISALVFPGGESTTLTKLLTPELRAAIEVFCKTHPVWGTCAGMIMLSKNVEDPRVVPFGLMELQVDRNGFGRQVFSFEAELKVAEEIGAPEKPLHGIFIRAPRVKSFGKNVKPLIWLDDEPVCLRQDHVLVSSFHPELTAENRLHRYFLSMIA